MNLRPTRYSPFYLMAKIKVRNCFRNFINKINGLDILIKLTEKDMSSSRKGSFLYQFDKEKYDKKVEDGFTFKI